MMFLFYSQNIPTVKKPKADDTPNELDSSLMDRPVVNKKKRKKKTRSVKFTDYNSN